MNFKEEYKKSADSISPDKEAIDRMKAAVLAKAAEGPERSAAESRKPLPLKRIAIIGGAAAACAVITISAISLLPSIRSANDLVEEASSSAVSMAEDAVSDSSAANDGGDKPQMACVGFCSEESVCAADDAMETDIIKSVEMAVSAESFTAEPEAAEAFPAEPSAAGGQVNDYQTEQEEAYAFTAAVTAEIYESTYECVDTTAPVLPSQTNTDAGAAVQRPGTDGVMTASEPDMPDEGKENPATGGPPGYCETTESAETMELAETEETTELTDDGRGNPTAGWSPDYVIETAEIGETMDAISEEATSEAGYYETYEAPAPTEGSAPKLVLTGKGWLTYDGERYNEDAEIIPAEPPELIVKRQNVMDKRFYYVNLDGDILTLYDEKMNFIGAYRKR